MELNDFQRQANRTDQRPGRDEGALLFPVIGLSSEVGSLVRHVKKRLRDQDAYELFSGEVTDELGAALRRRSSSPGRRSHTPAASSP